MYYTLRWKDSVSSRGTDLVFSERQLDDDYDNNDRDEVLDPIKPVSIDAAQVYVPRAYPIGSIVIAQLTVDTESSLKHIKVHGIVIKKTETLKSYDNEYGVYLKYPPIGRYITRTIKSSRLTLMDTRDGELEVEDLDDSELALTFWLAKNI